MNMHRTHRNRLHRNLAAQARDQRRNLLALAVVAGLLAPAQAFAQDAGAAANETQPQPAATDSKDAKTLDKVVVTGSLIPRSQLETATPVTTITASDIRARGFTSVSDALQKSIVQSGYAAVFK